MFDVFWCFVFLVFPKILTYSIRLFFRRLPVTFEIGHRWKYAIEIRCCLLTNNWKKTVWYNPAIIAGSEGSYHGSCQNPFVIYHHSPRMVVENAWICQESLFSQEANNGLDHPRVPQCPPTWFARNLLLKNRRWEVGIWRVQKMLPLFFEWGPWIFQVWSFRHQFGRWPYGRTGIRKISPLQWSNMVK